MTYIKATDIAQVFKEVEEEFEDKSTEFILEVTAERCRMQMVHPSCESSDVAEALEITNRK